MFGLFKKKKPPTMMDAMIRLVYGPNPPPKSADLERSIAIAYRDLLCERVPLAQVKQRAGELPKGPIPHSTHDLAVSTALGFFRDPEYMPALRECQIVARLRVADWAKDGSVPLLLAQTFEEVLYRRYKPQLPKSPERLPADTLPPKIRKPPEASPSSSPQPQPAPRSPWAGSKRMDANTFWKDLKKADPKVQKRFFETLSSLTTREQRKEWLTSTPLWDQVAPPVVEAILDAITDRGLFEAFVLTSMTDDLVSKYEMVGREEADKALIRARISQILCQLGNKARVSFAQALQAKADPKDAARDATLAEIAFESAIAMAKDQIVAYEGLSVVYGMAGNRAKCHDYAKRGLAELADAKLMRSMMSRVIPPEAFDEMEQRLRQYLNR
jgi:hypothetical protein